MLAINVLTVLGIVLVAASGWRLSRVDWGDGDPLRAAGLSSRDRSSIRRMIRKNQVSSDQERMLLMVERAEYDDRVGPALGIWVPVFGAGVALIVTAGYPVSWLMPVAIGVQVVVVLVVLNSMVAGRRTLRTSRR